MKNYLRGLFCISIFSFLLISETFSQSVYFNNESETGVKMNILNTDYNSTRIEFLFNGYNQKNININGLKCLFLSADNTVWLMEKGFPQIPIFRGSIVIPDNAAMSYKITDESHQLINTGKIVPSKGHLTRDIDPDSVPYIFNEIYDEDTWYPSKKDRRVSF